ncbi:Kunitz-type serine protease inhibitor TCI [Armadillidium vulgare]|nr:Kunitz-type serine protease inhibitor TCI [Armadillidium vulgare]
METGEEEKKRRV